MRVVVVGAGIAGLGSALALARSGHQVTILERDSTPMPESADAAFEWSRKGAPQVRHSHALLARLRNLLVLRAPDVLDALLDAGATEMRFTDNLPDTLTDRGPMEGDEELVALACRRTTFEWVLRRCVTQTAGVEIRDGVVVDGVEVGDDADDANDGVVRVVGVRTDAGVISADLVLDATGPRTGSARWLADAGVAEPDPDLLESEIVYLSRFYRFLDGSEQPATTGPVAGDLGYAKYAVFLGDNRTFSMTFAVDSDDRELRVALASDEGFDAAARLLVNAAPWIDGRSVAITPVHVMAGLRNRKRRFVVDGAPIVTGFVAVGDAAVCTNPLYGRGCSLALIHAFGVVDALNESDGDLVALAAAVDELTTREIDPWFKAAVMQDREALEQRLPKSPPQGARASASGGGDEPQGARASASGGGDEPQGARASASGGGDEPQGARASASGGGQDDDVVDPKAWARAVFREGLLPATRTSPVVFRAFLRWFNLLATPDALMNDPAVIGAALQAYQDRGSRPPEVPVGPATRSLFVEGLVRAGVVVAPEGEL